MLGWVLLNRTLWTPAYAPGDGQTIWVYCTALVYKLLFNCQ
jgi:hypothetical protein